MAEWLWRTIFGPRPTWWNIPAILLWAIFGNAEDGAFGHYEPTSPRDWRTAARWWLRNPMHNLTHHLIAPRFARQIVLIGNADGDPGMWPVGHFILSINGLPFVAIQFARWEAYIGFRPRRVVGVWRGVFGAALRKR